ncbi:MAG: MBL fold metallo-hydrolase RNA specificity domain-containing protein, partial [Clostridia bacterium]
KIIISSSGMCEAGRIRHHLKHNIWKTENTILFIGYQAEGTLGRRIVDGAESVHIFGETLEVNARVEIIDGFSGHGDMNALDAFLAGFKKKPKKVFLVHGEAEQIIPFRDRIQKKFGIDAIIPKLYEVYELTCEACRSVTPEAERTIREFSYKRLELLNYIKKIETSIHALTEKVSYDIMNQLDDEQVETIIDEYRTIDGGVMRILDSIAKDRKEKDE